MGRVDDPEYVSETRNLYRYIVNLVPKENSSRFDVIQDRGCGRKFYANCAVTGFELRIVGGEAIKLKLDIGGEHGPEPYPYQDMATTELTERFMGDGVSYRINDTDYQNIYGITVSVKKEGGTKTELRIRRYLLPGIEIPELIDEMTVTARLYRGRYEDRHDGMFRLTFSRLLLQADGSAVDTGGAVIGPLRYYCAGSIKAHVFTADGRTLG
jgi:hypothetical protein